MDGTGRTAPIGEPGELILRNPWPAMCVATEGEAVDHWAEGSGDVYKTVDLAYRNTAGEIVVLGRKDPLVNISGQLVSLTEIAAVIAEHPDVADVEVIAVEGSEPTAVIACVVLEPGTIPGEELIDDHLGDVQQILGGLARPRAVVFVESFPPELDRVARRMALARIYAHAAAGVRCISKEELLSAGTSAT